jgi:hypothetical protein
MKRRSGGGCLGGGEGRLDGQRAGEPACRALDADTWPEETAPRRRGVEPLFRLVRARPGTSVAGVAGPLVIGVTAAKVKSAAVKLTGAEKL